MLTLARADRVLLSSLSWQQFEDLLGILGDRRSARLAYDQGTLEIMTPLPEHEYYKEHLGDVIKAIAECLDLDFACYGSSTWKREKMATGVEPDNCFYFQHEPLIRGQLQFDLEQDPPPDLVLEVDLTHKSLPRFPLYARLGIPEIWCYDAGSLKIYQLHQGVYQETARSGIFPALAITELPQLMESYRLLGRRRFRHAIREWIESQILA